VPLNHIDKYVFSHNAPGAASGYSGLVRGIKVPHTKTLKSQKNVNKLFIETILKKYGKITKLCFLKERFVVLQ